jgi:hypothetical protein
MERKRHWLGWIAVGLGALALAVALLGRGFGPQFGIAGGPSAARQQQSAPQQNAQPQRGPSTNAQPDAGQQNTQPQRGSAAGPQAGAGQNAQPNVGRHNAGPQAGPGGEARRGGERPGGGGFGMGGWLQWPFLMIGGSFQWAMLALLIGLGVWMLRGRNTAAANTGRAEPAQAAPSAPLSPTGEAYREEPSEEE